MVVRTAGSMGHSQLPPLSQPLAKHRIVKEGLKMEPTVGGGGGGVSLEENGSGPGPTLHAQCVLA